MARKLIHAGIIHGQADLGSLAERVTAMAQERLSAEAWRTHQRQTQEFWRRLKATVMERVGEELSGGDWTRLRIYQDGMPAAGETARRIVEELAEKGSPNYQLVQELMAKGAQLEHTEQADLLKQEYRLLRAIIVASGPGERDRARQEYARVSEGLLAQRDRFIAGCISNTLKEGEVGLLFIGALHQVEDYLPKDIEIISMS